MSDNSADQRFFAYALMTVGGLIAVLSSGCTLFFIGMFTWSTIYTLHQNSAFLMGSYATGAIGGGLIAIIVGCLPAAIGVALFVVGRRMVKGEAVQRFFAYVLMAVGGLITLLCGGCTAFYLWFAATSAGSTDEYGPSMNQLVGLAALIVGGLPTVFGVLIFLNGLWIKRRANASRWPDIKGPSLDE